MVRGGKAEPFFRKLRFKVVQTLLLWPCGIRWGPHREHMSHSTLHPSGTGQQPFRSSVSKTSQCLRVWTEVVSVCTLGCKTAYCSRLEVAYCWGPVAESFTGSLLTCTVPPDLPAFQSWLGLAPRQGWPLRQFCLFLPFKLPFLSLFNLVLTEPLVRTRHCAIVFTNACLI